VLYTKTKITVLENFMSDSTLVQNVSCPDSGLGRYIIPY